jgi:hypothetical protein
MVYSQSIHLGAKPLETDDQHFLQQNTCGHRPYVTSSLTRVCGCHLQLLLVLASAVILRSESRGAHDHILLSQIRNFLNLEDQVPIFISPGTGWPGYIFRHWDPFASPPTTRRAAVEVFDPSSTWARLPTLGLRLTANHESHRFPCVYVYPLSLLGNGSVNTFPHQ